MYKLEKYIFQEDIKVFYVVSESFPEGIPEAFKRLKKILSTTEGRRFYGISCPNEKGKIIYLAAVEQLDEGEAEKLNCKTLTLKQGDYLACLIENYETKMESIGALFSIILKNQDIDPQGYCVEMYVGERDVRCAVRLKN